MNNLVPNSFVLSQQEERVNSPVKNKSEAQEMVLGSACGRLSGSAQQKPTLPLVTGRIQDHQALAITPHTCRGLSHGTGSGSHESAPGSGNLDSRKDIGMMWPCVMTLSPKRERSPGSQNLRRPSLPTLSLPICSLTPWEL